MTNLKPCPWPQCRSDSIVVVPNGIAEFGGQHGITEQEAFYCHCDGCGADGPVMDSHNEAVAAWNTRAPAWQPIETAPKPSSGKWLDKSELFLIARKGSANIGIAQSVNYAKGEGSYIKSLSSNFVHIEYADDAFHKLKRGTHWQPLPTPPEENS